MPHLRQRCPAIQVPRESTKNITSSALCSDSSFSSACTAQQLRSSAPSSPGTRLISTEFLSLIESTYHTQPPAWQRQLRRRRCLCARQPTRPTLSASSCSHLHHLPQTSNASTASSPRTTASSLRTLTSRSPSRPSNPSSRCSTPCPPRPSTKRSTP